MFAGTSSPFMNSDCPDRNVLVSSSAVRASVVPFGNRTRAEPTLVPSTVSPFGSGTSTTGLNSAESAVFSTVTCTVCRPSVVKFSGNSTETV